jgi:hypothetical protein
MLLRIQRPKQAAQHLTPQVVRNLLYIAAAALPASCWYRMDLASDLKQHIVLAINRSGGPKPSINGIKPASTETTRGRWIFALWVWVGGGRAQMLLVFQVPSRQTLL